MYTTNLDLFYDEVIEYAEHLESAGVAVTLQTVPGAAHTFELFEKTEPSRLLFAHARGWLAIRLELQD
ncbi:alpha/beta hydrolase [Microbacterium aurum]